MLRMERMHTFFYIVPGFSRHVSLSVVCTCLQLCLVLSEVLAPSCADENYHINWTSNKTVCPDDMKPLNVSLAFLSSVRKTGRGKFYAGAFFVAVDELNRMAAANRTPVEFHWTFQDTDNRETEAIKQMSLLSCEQNVSAFIGPDVYCKSAGLLATALSIPYITFNCEENHNDTVDLLLVNTQTSLVYVSRFIMAVLEHYQWRSFWLVTGDSIKWTSVANQLRKSAAAKNISINGEVAEPANEQYGAYLFHSDKYRNILENSKHRTRVYIFLGLYESLLMFVREMVALGLTQQGEYAVVAVDDSNSRKSELSSLLNELEGRASSNLSSVQVQQRLLAMQNVLVVSPLKRNINRADFESAVYNRSLFPPICLSRPPSSISKPPNIHGEAYPLYDATIIYGKSVMELMATPGADPLNATQIINHIRCRLHDSIDGQNIWIHENGESEGSYKVEGFHYQHHHLDHVTALRHVGNFSFVAGRVPVFHPDNPVVWISGRLPVSNPLCGFNGELCPSSQYPVWKLVSTIFGLSVLVCFIVATTILGARHYMYEQKLERLAWKIEIEDIQILTAGQLVKVTTPVRAKKKVSCSSNQLRSLLLDPDSDPDIVSNRGCTSGTISMGVYKGISVVVRKLTRKNLELTRSVKKQLQLRKELTHDNINRFIGACIEQPHVYLVTQYCPRHSLQDILNNEDLPLDHMFVTSLVQDLIRGMSFIHDSEITYHGNLKSSNCLVDSRWTLKLTDFGLTSLGPSHVDLFDDEETARGLLWTAPELLRCRRRSSNSSSSHSHHFHHIGLHDNHSSSNNNNSISSSYSSHFIKGVITGSQKGDVYSFAIILYELYGKSGPWGGTTLTSIEIIESLLSSSLPALRPDTTTLVCDSNVINLMQACWDNDPDLRPDFKYGIRNRFKPIQQSCLNSNIFDNMLAMMEKHANNLEAVVAERTEQLRQEKRMTENLLLRMLPRSVAEKLKRGQRVEAEQFEQVSIYFSDIVGFTELSAESSPMEVVDLLNDLYTCFDSIIEDFDVYKVETIGDAYMVVSGLPLRNGDRHAGEIASMSLLLLEAIKRKQFRIRGSSNHLLKIRIGIHSGPCCAGVVGLKMPRYCLFGDTVNTASRLESTGEALKIHCSSECKTILDKLGGYTLAERGYTEMKGKGRLLTYFLLSEDRYQRHNRIDNYKRMGRDGRCVSSSNLDYSGNIFSVSNTGVPSASFHHSRNTGGSKYSATNTQDSLTSLVTTSDKNWAQASDQPPSTSSAPPHEFISSTLPRVSNARFNNPKMSPIAEDPSCLADRVLEKTVSFPDSSLHDSSVSENEASLGRGLALATTEHKRNVANRRTQSSRSLLARSSKPGVCRMKSFSEDAHPDVAEVGDEDVHPDVAEVGDEDVHPDVAELGDEDENHQPTGASREDIAGACERETVL